MLFFSSAQSLSHVRLFATLWTAARQASLSITNSRSVLPKPVSIELVMPSNHLIVCRPLLLPSIFPSIRVFSNESALRIRWPKYWSFSFNISPSGEHPGLISFTMDWLDLLAVVLNPVEIYFCIWDETSINVYFLLRNQVPSHKGLRSGFLSRGFEMWPSSESKFRCLERHPGLSCPLAVRRGSCHFLLFPLYSSPLLLLILLRTSFSCHTLELSDLPRCISVITGKEMAFSHYCRSVQNVSLQFGSAVMLIIPKYVNYRLRHTNHINRYSLCLSLGVSWFLLPLPVGFLPIHLPTIMSTWKGFVA